MRHGEVVLNISMTSQIDVGPACRCSFFYLSLGLVWACEIEISHMGKNNGNPDLVCEKKISNMLRVNGLLEGISLIIGQIGCFLSKPPQSLDIDLV